VVIEEVEKNIGIREDGAERHRRRGNAAVALREEGLGQQGAGDSVRDRIHNSAFCPGWLVSSVESHDLTKTIGDSSAGQIVWGELQGDPVPRKDADAVFPQSPGQMGQN